MLWRGLGTVHILVQMHLQYSTAIRKHNVPAKMGRKGKVRPDWQDFPTAIDQTARQIATSSQGMQATHRQVHHQLLKQPELMCLQPHPAIKQPQGKFVIKLTKNNCRSYFCYDFKSKFLTSFPHCAAGEASANAEGWNGSVAWSSSNQVMVELVPNSPRVYFPTPKGWWLLIEKIYCTCKLQSRIKRLQTHQNLNGKNRVFSANFAGQPLFPTSNPARPAPVVRSNLHGQSAARIPRPRLRVLVDARRLLHHHHRNLCKRPECQPGNHPLWCHHFIEGIQNQLDKR